MSREDVDVVRYVLTGGRKYLTTELIDPEMRLDLSERVFNPAVYEGREGLARWAREVDDVWEGYEMELCELLDGDHAVLAIVREHGRGRTSGAEVDRDVMLLCRLQAGLVSEIRLYSDRGQAMQDAGLVV